LNGRRTPWNALALWDLIKIAQTGFQLVSEGLVVLSHAGVEEVAIAMLQKLLASDHVKAKLCQLPGIKWKQDFKDLERHKWHEEKMKSKVAQPAA
jgi:methionine salvage enolase-phosphatase E1